MSFSGAVIFLLSVAMAQCVKRLGGGFSVTNQKILFFKVLVGDNTIIEEIGSTMNEQCVKASFLCPARGNGRGLDDWG